MNPLLSLLQPYPFERLRQLFAGITPAPEYRAISLGIGEPKHPTPQLIKDALTAHMDGLASYPATAGDIKLREACAGWLERRYGVKASAATQILPVNGSREALFAFAQTVIDPSQPGATVVSPNPFYQIYEGAAYLAGLGTGVYASLQELEHLWAPERTFYPTMSPERAGELKARWEHAVRQTTAA